MMIKEKPIIFSGPSIPAIQNLKPGVWPAEPIDPGAEPVRYVAGRHGGGAGDRQSDFSPI
jgi:hypothetical protein